MSAARPWCTASSVGIAISRVWTHVAKLFVSLVVVVTAYAHEMDYSEYGVRLQADTYPGKHDRDTPVVGSSEAEEHKSSDRNFQSPRPYRTEPVYAVFTYDRQVILEVQLVDRLTIYENSWRPEGIEKLKKDAVRWGVAAHAVGMVRFRMLAERNSAPVESPSYLPRLDVHVFRTSFETKNADTIKTFTFGWNLVPFAHHSNGQDGDLFETYSTEDMAGTPTMVEEINRNGSFSTNYVSVGMFFDHSTLASDGRVQSNLRYSGRYEVHPEWYPIPGSISEPLKSDYGNHRLRGQVDASRSTPWGDIELSIVGERSFGVGEDVEPVMLLANVVVYPAGWRWGLFLRNLAGRDYYNLEYRHRELMYAVGVVYRVDW